MHLQRLLLTQFRNYEYLDLEIPYRIVCLTGANGMGKTNILEAVKYLATTRGFGLDKNAVQSGSTFFMTEGRFLAENQEAFTVQCSYMERRGKKILLDGEGLPKLSLHFGKIPLVAVLPSDTELIYGGGTERRAWLDALISQFDPQYLQALIAYDKALTQRNALLQHFLEHHSFDAAQLEGWSAQLAEHGSRIGLTRAEFIQDFSPAFGSFYQKMIAQGEEPVLKYESGLGTDFSPMNFLTLLQKSLARDRASGRTQAGTHRDEIQFLLNGQAVRYFGSQGQQKTFVTSLQLAQFDFLRKRTGKTPILLLDDIFDKLDENRVKHIAGWLLNESGGQVFLTDTSLPRLRNLFSAERNDIWGMFEVTHGTIKQV